MEILPHPAPEPPTTDGREIKGASMRARLRAATEELIIEVGLEGASTVEIAKRCGVSRGAMLHHYATRDELLIDTAQHFWQKARDKVSVLADDMSAGRTGVSDFVERLYDDVFRANSIATMLELMVAGRTDSVLGRAVSDILTNLFHSYEELGERAFAPRGVPPEKIRVIVTLIVCALRGLRMQNILDPDDAVAKAVKAALIEAVQQIFAAGAAPVRKSATGSRR
jgi:AcrR family transcriptional regulator